MGAWARLATSGATLGTTAAALVLALLATACGDSDGGPQADAGPDASPVGGSGGGFTSRRPDAQVLSGDPVPPCDRLDPLSCGAGQECEVVVRRAAGEDGFSIYDGCIESRPKTRGRGEPCEPFGGFLVPYAAPGLEDEVFYDPCDIGLYCAPDPYLRNTDTCQPSCISGALACDSPGEYCLGPDPLREVCIPSDQCNPLDPEACGPGAGCYLRLGDQGDRVLTVCLPTAPEPVADGDACSLISDCNPGSSCFGPTRLPPNRWVADDLLCRRGCSPGPDGGDDGGVAVSDPDAGGGGGGGCPAGLRCVPFADSGLATGTIPVPLGQCE